MDQGGFNAPAGAFVNCSNWCDCTPVGVRKGSIMFSRALLEETDVHDLYHCYLRTQHSSSQACYLASFPLHSSKHLAAP